MCYPRWEGLQNIHTTANGKIQSLQERAGRTKLMQAQFIAYPPMVLSFEHTNLLLARVSEKALLELWGPRLKKCPVGWAMLSDRGFWNTARFYPNLNRQLTPKFLSGRKQFTAEEVSVDSR